MIYLVADTHFGHTKIIEYCNRPFANVDEMNNVLIQNWNATVKSDDDVYILGDFAFGAPETVHKYAMRLNGKKYLIRGNHDKFLDRYQQYEIDFVWVKEYVEISLANRKFVLFHYPIAEWAGYYKDTIHCYGHVHKHPIARGSIETRPKQYAEVTLTGRAVNVGVDVNDYRPLSVYEVIRAADKAAGG